MKFSQTLSGRVRTIDSKLSAISDFDFHLRAALETSVMDIRRLLPAYEALEPAIHNGVSKPFLLDIQAWSYAVHRLPRDINSLFILVLSTRTLNIIRSLSQLGDSIPTLMRRRTCRLMMPGKAFILLRPGHTDLTDLVTCLCLHVYESRKMRHLMRPINRSLALISDGLHRINDKGENREAVSVETLRRITPKLTSNDIAALLTMWPTNMLEQLRSVCFHHGDYVLYTDNVPIEVSTASASDNWENRLLAATHQLIGRRIDSTCVVDIISSNTHSVIDCLSPYLHSNRQRIEEWAEIALAACDCELSGDDKLYWQSAKYFEAFPHLFEARLAYDRAAGILSLDEYEFTGITVQLIDVSKLKAASGSAFADKTLLEYFASPEETFQHLVVNIDFAFGEQAQHVMRSLLLTYGKSVRSVNIMGKAGGLCGSRGDILFPTHFINEKRDIPDYRYCSYNVYLSLFINYCVPKICG